MSSSADERIAAAGPDIRLPTEGDRGMTTPATPDRIRAIRASKEQA